MGVLEKLTAKQDALCAKVAGEYLANLTRPKKLTSAIVNRWLDVAYGLFDKKRPDRIEVIASPQAALALAAQLTGTKQDSMDWCGVGDGGWVAFYDYFHRIGVLTDKEISEVLALRDFASAAWDTMLLDECAIVVGRPKVLRLDDEGNLHAGDGPCIEWPDGNRDYAHHGQWVPERFILSPRSHTREEYLAIRSTEERRALSEIAGWDWVAQLLGAKEIDAWTDGDTRLRYELLACDDGQKLLRKQSPALKNQSQPTYLEPVHEDLKTARAARKWQATDLSPAECERAPELVYGIEA